MFALLNLRIWKHNPSWFSYCKYQRVHLDNALNWIFLWGKPNLSREWTFEFGKQAALLYSGNNDTINLVLGVDTKPKEDHRDRRALTRWHQATVHCTPSWFTLTTAQIVDDFSLFRFWKGKGGRGGRSLKKKKKEQPKRTLRMKKKIAASNQLMRVLPNFHASFAFN